MRTKWTCAAIGTAWGTGFLVVAGLVSVLIPNPLFTRMTPVEAFNLPVLVFSSLLVGSFMGRRAFRLRAGAACGVTAGSGGLAAFLGFSCPICNKVLVALIGSSGALTWIEPYQGWFSLAGLVTLAAANVWIWWPTAAAGPERPRGGAGLPARPRRRDA